MKLFYLKLFPMVLAAALTAGCGAGAGAQKPPAETTALPSPLPAQSEHKATRFFDVTAFGAVPGDEADDTEGINAAIEAAHQNGGGTVYIPAGVYRVDPAVGILVRKGTTIIGDGDDATVLYALPGAGSVIRRTFDPKGPNEYVDNVLISRLAVVLSHPRITEENQGKTYAQIGFDFRHITRSTIEECYVGNYRRGALDKIDGDDGDCSWREMIQGYGIVLGNTSASSPAYCGGEVNTVSRCTVFGARKAIVLDDTVLSPQSAAHATVISNCDIQICEAGIAQESKYTAGCSFNDNIIQAVGNAGYAQDKLTSAAPTYFLRIEGYGNTVRGGYIEDQGRAKYVLYLGSESRQNKISLGYYDTYDGLIADLGRNNVLAYFDHKTGEYVNRVNGQAVNIVP